MEQVAAMRERREEKAVEKEAEGSLFAGQTLAEASMKP